MRIGTALLLASILLASIAGPSGSAEDGREGFVVSTRVLAENCTKYALGSPSIEGDIVAWTDYQYTSRQNYYIEELSVKWIDLHDMVVRNVTFEGYAFLPWASDGRIAFNGEQGATYLFNITSGSTELISDRGSYVPRLYGDILLIFNSSIQGLDVMGVSNGTEWTLDIHSSDYDLWGRSLALVRNSMDTIEVRDVFTGETSLTLSGVGSSQDLSIAGGTLAWRMAEDRGDGRWVVLWRNGTGIVNVTEPLEMRPGNIDLSERYVVWTGKWNVENASSNIFIYDIPSGRTFEVFSNGTEEYYPSVDGARVVYYRLGGNGYDLMLTEVLSSPVPAPEREERPDIGSILGPTLALDMALVVACLCLALLPRRSPSRSPQRPRRGGERAEVRLSGPERRGGRPPPSPAGPRW